MKNKIVIFRSKGPIKNIYLKNKLKELDFNVSCYPILVTKKIYSKELNIEKDSTVFTTSFNSIAYLSTLTMERNFKLYSLGQSSTRLAKKLGFKNIIECNGDSARMLEGFVDKNKKSLNNKKEHIIYVGAKDISYNLPGELKGLGYKVKRYKVYDTINIVSFHQKFINTVKKRKVDWIILLSKKGAKNFCNLSNKLFTEEDISKIKFACLSKNISNVLSDKIYRKFYPKFPSIKNIQNIIINSEK